MNSWAVICIKPLESFPIIENETHDNQSYVLNIYCFERQLVGVIEDTNYRQLFEMSLSPAEYIEWRFNDYWPSALLDVRGMPMKNNVYKAYLHEVSLDTGYPIFSDYQRYL